MASRDYLPSAASLFLYAPSLPAVTASATPAAAAIAPQSTHFVAQAGGVAALPLPEVQLTRGPEATLLAVTTAVAGAAAAAPQLAVPAAVTAVAGLGVAAGVTAGVPLVGLLGKRAFGMMQGEGSGRRAGMPAMVVGSEEQESLGNEPVSRRAALAKALGASALVGAAMGAKADIDYAGVGFLGGSSTIDVNNSNVRVYTKLPGMYPNAAGKIVTNAPYKDKADMYAKAKLTAGETEAVKKYDSKFIFLEPRPEYIIDNINNGLYR